MQDTEIRSLLQEIKHIANPENKDLFIVSEKCPCCNSSKIKDYFSKLGFNHSICTDCEFIFVNPTPKEEVLDKLYDGLFYTNSRKYIEVFKANRGDEYYSTSISHADAVELMKRITSKNISGEWLDIGGGTGSFLNYFNKLYPNIFNFSLLESNSLSGDFARQSKINVFNNLSEIKTKFNIVSLLAVLEHITKPQEIFKNIYDLLDEKGLFVISVPRTTRLTKLYRQQYQYFLPPYHVSMFSEKNIEIALKNNGFEIVEMWQGGEAAFHFEYFFDFCERGDAQIPFSNTESTVGFYEPPLNSLEKMLLFSCHVTDKITAPLRKIIDGKILLNIIAKKK